MTLSAPNLTSGQQPSVFALKRSHSLESVIEAFRGVGPGFDALRLGLAFIIFYAHTNFAVRVIADGILNGAAAQTVVAAQQTHSSWFADLLVTIKSRVYVVFVPMFFALSGFLVTASALRLKRVPRFLWFRGLRIFPALTVEVVLSAFILGMFFSTLPLSEYLTHPEFFRYFGNILGIISFHLPGVFIDNPISGIVNINLWTLPAEFYCYLLLSGVMLLGALHNGKVALAVWIALFLVAVIANSVFRYGINPAVYPTTVIVLHFFVGMAFFLWSRHIPMHPALFILSGLVVLATIDSPQYSVLTAPFLTYVTVYIGFIPFLKMDFMKGRDYSYGIYLYGFPVTQAVVAATATQSNFVVLAIAFPITVLIAALSWHYVEKPMLRFKR